ncbi:GGDEF domain-containing protein [Acidocella sp.]|jgi:diguanylate cyclase (GGDEF)-like protein|uniref:GGDEF domain-containing protein n=1 Tax=Acidocella sp. TaxID=50710 RepID=UPI002F41B003
MTALDPKTLFLAILLVLSLMSAACVPIWLQDRSQKAVLWMAGGCMLFCFGMVSRVALPFLPAIIISNALVFAFYGLIWTGCRNLLMRPARLDVIAAFAVIWCALCLTPQIRDSMDLRTGAAGLVIMALILLTMREIWQMRLGALSIRGWLLCLYGAHAFLTLHRTLTALGRAHPGNPSFTDMPGFTSLMIEALAFTILTGLGLIGLSKEVSDRRHRQAARSDFMTGVANRRHFEESLQRHFDRASKNGRHLALIMIDADEFKAYNDLYGHPAGDKCLRALSTVFLATCRPGDVVGRYGGEEFAILLPNTSSRAAHAVANRLLMAVRDLRLKHTKRPNGFATISLGVASLTPETELLTAVELLEAADRALYRAKQEGRDRVCHADDECELPVMLQASS